MSKLSHVRDYANARKKEYPSVEEQIDMLWHSMNDGLIPKSEPFYSRIKEVKDKFPKPQ